MVAVHAAYYLPDPERFDPLPMDEFGEYESVSDGELDDDPVEAIEANLAAWHDQWVRSFSHEDCPF